MREIAERALDTASAAGARYADCRIVESRVEVVTVRNGVVAGIRSEESVGLGVRVLIDRSWGFAATGDLDGAAVDAAVERASRIARASAAHGGAGVVWTPRDAVLGEYVTPHSIDPMAIPLEKRIAVLLDADAQMAGVAGITTRQGSIEVRRERRFFASTEGSRITQTIIETGGGLDATAAAEGEVQTRSYPNSFGRHQQCCGWELIEEMDLPGNAGRIAEEAVQLLTADPCPTGRMTVILDSTQTALQVHESCGHPTELDRVLGWEAAYAGTSFLTPELLGTFRYGSDAVTISADATRARGLGTFGWDDEGTPAQRTLLVDRGRFTGYLTSRETAATLGQTSNGTMRAASWTRLPIIRMTNINLEPGESSLDEMIAGTDRGVYLQTNRSWSIDDRRLNFQFGTQIGWEIVNGRRTRMVRNPLYAGTTPEFWNSCDAVAGPDEWTMWGVVNCGKGQPSQVMRVGHGAAPARFRNVAVRGA